MQVLFAALRPAFFPALPSCGIRESSEGRACRVHRTMLDHPFRFDGHDERAPRAFGGTCLSGPQPPFGVHQTTTK
jgi:hypothetical protein